MREGVAEGCLDAALGEGEDVVVDHASGASKKTWKLGEAGDAIVLDEHLLELRPPAERELTEVPKWTEHLPAVVKALADCKP
jgi:hypothetical protein